MRATSSHPDGFEFPAALRRRIDDYFATRNISKGADWTMAVKIIAGLTASVLTYAIIYSTRLTPLQFVLAYIIHGLTQLFLLLNVAHDSNHHAVSSRRLLSKLLCFSFDIFGINSYIWRVLHNSSHHSNINVFGDDEDVLARGFLRFSPDVRRTVLHRYQHLYAWVLYGFSTLEYVLLKDFEYFFFPRYNPLRRARHPASEYVLLFAGKSFYFAYMIVFPAVFLARPLWLVIVAFAAMHFVMGLIAQLIFQTTHIIETSSFPHSKLDFENYTYHVLATTADYSTESTLARWFLGGLNHHVVHHLCPNVCHCHYPNLTKIVRDTAVEYGVPYREHRTVWHAVARHFYLLRRLGDQPTL